MCLIIELKQSDMKKILTIFVFSLFSILVKGQGFSVKLFVTDSYNRKDTIEFGLNFSATIGTDSSFGEQDLFGQPWDSLDMRIIQRDSMSHHCLKEWFWSDNYTAPEIYYPVNRDFKVDIRPFEAGDGSAYTYFEILIKSVNPPITITTDYSDIKGTMFESWSSLCLLDTNCNTVEINSFYYRGDNDTIYTLNDTLTTLAAVFAHEVGVEETNWEKIKIYPNPAHSEVTIVADIPIMAKLYDVYGKKINECDGNKMNIGELKDGLYYFSVFDKNGNILKTEKLIKE